LPKNFTYPLAIKSQHISIVTKNIPEKYLAAGNPATIIKRDVNWEFLENINPNNLTVLLTYI